MRVELFPFQKRALADIRMKTAEAMGSYHRTHAPQVVSFTAPTGAGKTIIMSALIEAILFGDEQYMEQPDAIIVWLSDSVHDMFTTTDTDIERQFQIADVKLGREGIGMAYGNKYGDLSDLTAFKIDVILFVADENCMNRLHTYAENRFHGLNDDYRRYIATINSEKIRRDYDSIVSDGDVVSKHNGNSERI